MFLIYLQLPLCLCDETISLCLYLLLFPSPSPCDHPCPQKPVSRVRLSERKEEEESMLASRDWNHISQLKIVTAQKLLPHFCPNMPQTFYLFAAEATRFWPFSCHVWLQMSCDCMSLMKLSKEWSNTNLLPLFHGGVAVITRFFGGKIGENRVICSWRVCSRVFFAFPSQTCCSMPSWNKLLI